MMWAVPAIAYWFRLGRISKAGRFVHEAGSNSEGNTLRFEAGAGRYSLAAMKDDRPPAIALIGVPAPALRGAVATRALPAASSIGP